MSPDVAIQTSKLGKAYRLGTLAAGQPHHTYDFLGFDLPLQKFLAVLMDDEGVVRDDPSMFWALRDLDLEIKRGEMLGILGNNGSGKSTLLKILARVTEPTAGYADVNGLVGSLLEVGTGFHPELTGRQNVYLNGSIMGMSKDQITRRFDEMVEFAEVERFIDTPVKHYSSGMYMRLAFSVAAHMECDILIVDEVLAVGDASFQRKCLARIDDEVKAGKTVLFVSHNIGTVLQVCTRCVLFEQGRLVDDGAPQLIAERYMSKTAPVVTQREFSAASAPTSPERVFRLRSFHIRTVTGYAHLRYDVKEPIVFHMSWDVLEERYPLDVVVTVKHGSGVTLLVSADNNDSPWRNKIPAPGRYSAACIIPANLLNEGLFSVDFTVAASGRASEYVTIVDAGSFYVVDDLEPAGVRGDWQGKWFNSIIRPRLEWTKFESLPIDEHLGS